MGEYRADDPVSADPLLGGVHREVVTVTVRSSCPHRGNLPARPLRYTRPFPNASANTSATSITFTPSAVPRPASAVEHRQAARARRRNVVGG